MDPFEGSICNFINCCSILSILLRKLLVSAESYSQRPEAGNFTRFVCSLFFTDIPSEGI